ncbi:MAG: GntR family transcriptional regulator [Actinomycetota bacterium]
MILEVDPRSATPPYEQLRQQVTALVRAGALAEGAGLPAIRQLANDLGLAGGTVARAYRAYDEDPCRILNVAVVLSAAQPTDQSPRARWR